MTSRLFANYYMLVIFLVMPVRLFLCQEFLGAVETTKGP
jgi:hypothetical protein